MTDPQERDKDLQQDDNPKDAKGWEEAKKGPGNQAIEDPEKTKQWEDDK